MKYRTATPQEINALARQNIGVLDIRSREEWAREHLAGSVSVPLGENGFDERPDLRINASDVVVFHCQSGMRTARHADTLAALVAPASVLIMEGGINAWKKAGYPTQVNRKQPLPLMRQVQIIAGTLTLSGTLAGTLLSPWFYLIPGFVGTGLIFAGISGWCGMAKLLSVMPWNK
ncbi:rhodanese family protein [Yokenella regensburgei]|uniref:rhodanese-like domain-containing protein n=1 Tax=Yokenella regensburgei TaxID=158877 RepID=UPI003F162945